MAWVAEPSVEVVFGFIDAGGTRATMSVWMSDGEYDPEASGPAELGTALQAISNNYLNLVECRIRAAQSAPGDPTDGPYSRGADKLQLTWSGADGSTAQMQVGSPNEGVLSTDATTVDKADAAIVELIAQMKLYGKTAEGGAITGLKRGYRKRNAGRIGL